MKKTVVQLALMYLVSCPAFFTYLHAQRATPDSSENTSNSSVTNNFLNYPLTSGWSVEIPASWKVTRDFNQDMSEIMQSVSDTALKHLNQHGGSIETQLLAYKNLFGKKVSLTASILHNKSPITQTQLSNLNGSEKDNFERTIFASLGKNLVKQGVDPNTQIAVSIKKHDNLTTLVTTITNPTSGEISRNVQIPNGNQILGLEFNFNQSEQDLLNPIFTRIIESVNLP